MGEDYLFEFIRILSKDGEWKYQGQRENWLHAVSLAVDLVMDRRKLAKQKARFADRVETNTTVDVGPCGVVLMTK